jgi:type I restriction enzyme M protein
MTYDKSGMEYKERFRYGFCPEGGKKADLMFAQHMVSVLRPNGLCATVMPHGVLFRGGVEKDIRKGFLDDDLVEAVIGLPSNIFYGAGIPTCILILRAKGGKPAERRGNVLFINADREYEEGRAQNYLRPEHVEKIVWAYENFAEVPGYSRVVSVEELAENDWNLNIRRYADNSPPPEPQDVRAHLVGGVPKDEVVAQTRLFSSHGFDPMRAVLVERDADPTGGYCDFAPGIHGPQAIKTGVADDPGVQAKESELTVAFQGWWKQAAARLGGLPSTHDPMKARAEFMESFETALVPVGLLDRFKVSGVLATWWEHSKEEIRTVAERGFEELIDGWVESIRDVIEDPPANKNDAFDPFEHKLVRRLLPDYLAEIEEAEARVAELKAEQEAFENGETAEDGEWEPDEEDGANYAKFLQDRVKELKQAIRDGEGSEAASKEELADINAKLKPHQETKKKLSAARKELKALTNALLDRLCEARNALSAEECRDTVLDLARADLATQIDRYTAEHRQQVIATVENWWTKYAVSLNRLRAERDQTTSALAKIMEGLGYAG